jgi:hypothetical protein
MTFVDSLLTLLQSGFGFIGDMIYQLVQFLAKPLSYVYSFFEGIFYALLKLFEVVVLIVKIFTAFIQFFGAIVAGFFRTLFSMLTIDFSQTPINYPSISYQGIQVVIDLVQPMGLLTVVPSICLALIWFFFVKQMIGLVGGGITSGD